MTELEIFDWARGGLEDEAMAGFRSKLQSDPEMALEAAETRMLVEGLRSLTTEPTGRVEVMMRHVVRRHCQLRGNSPRWVKVADGARRVHWSRPLLQLAGVAAAVLVALVQWGRPGSEVAVGVRTEVAAALPEASSVADNLPSIDEATKSEDFTTLFAVGGDSLKRQYDSLEKLNRAGVLGSFVGADNDLALLRLEFRQRLSEQSRRRSIRVCGGRISLEDRIQDMAADVAGMIGPRLDSKEAGITETSVALRSLLAAGSTARVGDHRITVRRCVDRVMAEIGGLEGGELASALAALTDFAVLTGGQAASLVAEHAQRLAQTALEPRRGNSGHAGAEAGAALRRPPLLHYETAVASLADTGHVLRLAPAFGVHPVLAHRARLFVAAHLQERLAAGADERPDLLAALRYGFADLVDRSGVDQKLLLWHASDLVGRFYSALHHLAWSQFPLRPGWSEFQQELRGLASLETPGNVHDAAALLMTLSTNFAAPGCLDVLRLAKG